MNLIEAWDNEKAQEIFKYSFATTLRELNKGEISTLDIVDTIIVGENEIKLTDMLHPFAISSFISTGIHINKEYFEANKEDVIKDMVEYISSYSKDTFSVREPILITDEIITALANNPNIKEVYLGSTYNDNIYSLKQSDYEKLKSGGKESVTTYAVDPELEEVFDPIIQFNSSKQLFDYYTYESLTDENRTKYGITIGTPIREEQYCYIKYLPSDKLINISYSDCDNMAAFLNAIVEQQKNLKLNIRFRDASKKDELTNMLLKHQDKFSGLDLSVEAGLEDSLPFDKYLEYERRLFDLIAPAVNLSPFEKYLYAYKVVSHFKEYKENHDDKQESRKLYSILDNEYMVCVGYAKLLGDLLSKLGIESYDYSVTAETTFDKVSDDIEVMPEDLEPTLEHHARRIVNIVDPKYGIDGIYICDPTWDNYMVIDTFCYAALTPNEAVTGKRYFSFNNTDGTELLHINSLEEFYEKINYITNHTRNSFIMTSLSKNVTYAPELRVVTSLLSVLYSLDCNFVLGFIEKYPDFKLGDSNLITTDNKDYSLEELQNLLIELGEFILNKVNKSIPASTYEQALYQMYLNGELLGEEKAIEKTQKAMHNTYVITRDKFPKRMKIHPDGREEIYDNPENKFADYNLKREEKKL